MIRIVAALAVIIISVSAADAASRHKQRKHPRLPIAAPTLPQGQIYPNRPAWAPPGACFTDEGYGRFTPCDAGGGRGA
jgi:hypothetical protein